MLMEKKLTDDSKAFPGEVIEDCMRFFHESKILGLYPPFVHSDKAPAELAAIKVYTLYSVLMSGECWMAGHHN